MGFFALAGAGGVIGVHRLTAERIVQHQRDDALEAIHRLFPASSYDNDLLAQARQFSIERDGRASLQVTAYLARREGEPVATLLSVTTPDGYNGDIQLMVAVLADGTLTGVEVIAHRETPGLGDRIESERSGWLQQFSGVSLGNPGPDEWRIR